MKISLIIPVYNVEGFLERCLSSVENQTYKDIEVIIVNDGSTDNSYSIIEKYTAKNPHFKAFSIENRGLGGARNYGIEQSSGDYLIFLDSDDYISHECVQKFVEAAEKSNSDIVICNSCDVDEDGKPLSYYKNRYSNAVTNLKDEPTILFNRFSAWGKMYKKQLFNGFSFVSREWYEDLRLVPKLYLLSKSITYIEDTLFYYVQRAGSIMNNSNVKRNSEIITAFEDVISFYNENNSYEKFKAEFEYMILEHVVLAAVTRVAVNKKAEKKAVLQELQDFIAKFPDLYSNKYISRFSSSQKLILFFNKHKLYFLTALCFKLKNR